MLPESSMQLHGFAAQAHRGIERESADVGVGTLNNRREHGPGTREPHLA
jgi:hypothetical protein